MICEKRAVSRITRIAQSVGVPLAELEVVLDRLPARKGRERQDMGAGGGAAPGDG